MAMRYLVATIPSNSNYQLFDEDEETFSLSSYDPPVYGNYNVKSIYVNFSKMRHGSNDYYVKIDVNGVSIGETERKLNLLDTETTLAHTMWFDPKMDRWQKALTETGSITVKCIINKGNGYLALRGGCVITIGVEYEEETYNWINDPSNIIISPNNDGTFDISWDAASWSGPGNIRYFIKTPSIPGDITWDTDQTFLSNLPIPEYEEVIFYLWAKESDTGTTGETISKTYTFELPYKTIKYHNGERWVKCIPHYHNGTRWIRCDVHYHNGTGWKLSNH